MATRRKAGKLATRTMGAGHDPHPNPFVTPARAMGRQDSLGRDVIAPRLNSTAAATMAVALLIAALAIGGVLIVATWPQAPRHAASALDASVSESAERAPSAVVDSATWDGSALSVKVLLRDMSRSNVSVDIAVVDEAGETLRTDVLGHALCHALAYRVDTSSGKAAVIESFPMDADVLSRAHSVEVGVRDIGQAVSFDGSSGVAAIAHAKAALQSGEGAGAASGEGGA